MKKSGMIVGIIVMIALIGGIHYVVYQSLVTAFSVFNPGILRALQAAFAALGIGSLASLFAARKYSNFLTKALSAVTMTWIGFLIFLFFAACFYGVVAGIFALSTPGVSTLFFGRLTLSVGLLAGLFGVINAGNMLVTEYEVALPNLPPSWKGRRAAFVSDVHLGQIRSADFAAKVAGKIRSLGADIVFIGGDLYDGVKVDADAIIRPFRNLGAPLGTYFVMGNHEEYGGEEIYGKAIRAAGISILNDEKVVIDGMQIVGVDYLTTTSDDDFQKVLARVAIDRNKPSILLRHVPLGLAIAEQAGISLQLSGHTHRGQIWPLNHLTKAIYRGFDYGLGNLGAMQVLTSSGVGTWGPPLRIAAKSEIVLIAFR